jgi:DNA mismatch repair protein MutL
LANQIAAGEVVERPASVVKELLENSIDAGADRIELEVEQGGTRLIRVLDNGRGIHRDDLQLAIAPHATSKIYSQRELEQIASLGFRGEALASIASVSRFSLASRLCGEEQGWEMRVEGRSGHGEAIPSPLPQGTRVEVRDLFHNVPARRKFLRSERTEFLHIEEVLKRLALSRFDIGFTLIHNGRQVLRLRPAADAAQQTRRVGEILGQGFIQQALQLEYEAAGLRLWGWLARPEASRSQADNQYFYLNGRIVRDKLLNHAVRQAHQALLEPGRYPAYTLYLEVESDQVDVNVHPTKHEVRFRQTRLVHDFVSRSLLRALAAEESVTDGLSPQQTGAVEPTIPRSQLQFSTRPSVTPAEPARVAEQSAFYRQARESAATSRGGDDSRQPLGVARALLHQHYLLSESAGGPLLVELSAARETLLRQHLERTLAEGEVTGQPLLIPQTSNLPPGDADALLAASGAFRRLGFGIERLGEESVVLRQIPAICRGVKGEALLQTLLAQAKEQGAELRADSAALLQTIIAQLVAAAPVDLAEAGRVLRQLEALPDQGRAFCRPLTLAQLQQWFSGQTGGAG